MDAGGSASRESERLALKALEFQRLADQTRDKSGRFRAGATGERRVAQALMVLQYKGWRLLADRQWPATRSSNVDLIAIGPGGVFVIDVKAWRHEPYIKDGQLFAGTENRHREIGKVQAMLRPVHDALAGLGLAPSAVHGVLVFDGHRIDVVMGQIRLTGTTELMTLLTGSPRRLSAPDVDTVAQILEAAFPEMPQHEQDEPSGTPSDADFTTEALFDVQEVAAAALRAEHAAPMEKWMTFLDPPQLKTVRRSWNGPARISGAAGTGKSVVGLHRALYLAQQNSGTILLTTYVASLPKIHRQLVARIRPDLAHRVECVNMHAWARDLLDRRKRPYHLDARRAETEFSLAYKAGPLYDHALPAAYWHDEITYVIKGQGLTSFNDYATRPRPGRRTPLRNEIRAQVWDLYTDYEERLNAKGVHDHADILAMALAELEQRPETGISAVIIDEVQDLTLSGIRIAYQLTGDKPNGLLLIGDCRQTVYPGGYRLSDAGFGVRGRSEVLTVNYRNGSAILDAALDVLAGHDAEDLDGTVQAGRPIVQSTCGPGKVTTVHAETSGEHDALMLNAITALDAEDLANSAILCTTKDEAEKYRKQLARNAIAYTRLDRYDGTSTSGIKIGTVQRGKGLEFRQVFLPHYDRHLCKAALAPDAQDREPMARQQLHVAITRARDHLWMGTTLITPSTTATTNGDMTSTMSSSENGDG